MATQTVFLTGIETYTGNPLNDDFTVTDNVVGSNTLTLGNGIDKVTLSDAGSNTVVLGDGTDQISASGAGSSNTLTTGNGNDQVTVTGGSNTVTVGTGSDTIMLGSGLSNTLSTGAGNSTISVAGIALTSDTIHGAVTSGNGSTNKLVVTTAATMSPVSVYGVQSYQLANGGANALTLSDGNFVNLPQGSITVTGGDSGNTVNAASLSAGHAVMINGGAGLDMLTGGSGNDRFVFAPSNLSADTVAGGAGINTLELAAGPGQGTVSGLGGPNFSNLEIVDVDANANWLFKSTAAVSDTMYVFGTATDASLSGGGAQFVYGTANGTADVSGYQVVDAGGTTNGTTVTGGYEEVLAGGLASNTTVGGAGALYDYGTANGTTVNSGGQLQVSSGGVIASTTISGGSVSVASGGIINGAITFAGGGLLFDASAGAQADTVVGFSEGPDHLSFAGESTATENAVIASAQFNGGNTVLTFPDHTSIVLVGVTHVDTGIFA